MIGRLFLQVWLGLVSATIVFAAASLLLLVVRQ